MWLAAQRMNTALAGATLLPRRVPDPAAGDRRPHRRHRPGGRAPREAPADPAGRRAHAAHPLPDGRQLAHLPARARSGTAARPTTSAWCWPPPDWECVGYRLHDIDLVPTAEEDRLVGHLGPDVLGPDWDLDEALRRLRGAPRRADRRRAGRPAQPRRDRQPLQGRVAVHPRRPPVDAGRRRPRPRRRWSSAPATLMRANLHHPEQNTTGDPAARPRPLGLRPPRASPASAAAPRSCSASRARPLQERVTWWCPRCQAARSPIDPQARTGEPDHPQPVTLYR